MKMKFPTEEEFAKSVAQKALNEFEVNGKNNGPVGTHLGIMPESGRRAERIS